MRGFFQRQYSRKVSNSAGLRGMSRPGATLPAFHADHHALAIDVNDLQQRHFGAPHPRAVENHQQGALQEIAGGIDEPRASSKLNTVGSRRRSLG